MKKITLSLFTASLLLFGGINSASAQDDKKYAIILYQDSKTETDDLIITVDNAMSDDGVIKFKLVLENKSADYIVFKPEECRFIINGKESAIKEKMMLIAPYDKSSKVIDLKGAQYNTVKSYEFKLDGLYKVPADAKGIEGADFRLPASSNEFKIGPFTNTLGKVKKESDVTEAKVSTIYNGSKYGIIYPAKISVKMPDGNEYANANKKAKAVIMTKGEKEDFTMKWDRMEGGKTMDMQKVEMMVKWNDAFVEVDPIKQASQMLKIEMDLAKTEDKNK